MDDYSANTELRHPDSPIWPHVALYCVQFLFLSGPRFPARTGVLSATVMGLAIQAHLHPHFSNEVAIIQPFTIGWSYYLDTVSKFLFSGREGPEGEYWRLDSVPREALRYSAFSWSKIRWASALIINQRGIRWNHQVKNIPEIRARGRIWFLVRQTFQCIKCVLVADLLFELGIRIFFTSPDGTVGRVNSKYLTLRHPDWRWSMLKVVTFGCTPYFMLSMQFALLACVSVVLGLSKPEDWPSPFGRLFDTVTMRDFWGKFWHQQLRRTLMSYADHFADFLGIRRGTTLSSYTKLYVAFAISGLFHALSQLQMPSPTNISPQSRTMGVMYFFAAQALAITLEDIAQWYWRKTGLGLDARFCALLGYVWVFGVLWITLPLAGDTFLRMRMGEKNMLPFTLMKPVVEFLVPIPPEYFSNSRI